MIQRFDVSVSDKIETINEKLKKFCIGKGFTFIDNTNINESCLSSGKLHLNRRGFSYLDEVINKTLRFD